VKAAGQITVLPGAIFEVVALTVLAEQRGCLCFAGGAQGEPSAPTATEDGSMLGRDVHGRLQSGGLIVRLAAIVILVAELVSIGELATLIPIRTMLSSFLVRGMLARSLLLLAGFAGFRAEASPATLSVSNARNEWVLAPSAGKFGCGCHLNLQSGDVPAWHSDNDLLGNRVVHTAFGAVVDVGAGLAG
jgi:hypothetical protein